MINDKQPDRYQSEANGNWYHHILSELPFGFADGKTYNNFCEIVKKEPDTIAGEYEGNYMSFAELDIKSDIFCNYLLREVKIKQEEKVGFLDLNHLKLPVYIIGALKAGVSYLVINTQLSENDVAQLINMNKISIIVSVKSHIKILNDLQWQCKDFNTYICIDTDDAHHEDELTESVLMNKKLWEYVGKIANDDIEGGGWVNSYTGFHFTRREMDEYMNNIFVKLKPYLSKESKVLEIGCASGISMYKLAPYVNLYYGTDFSKVIIKKNEQNVREMNINNIKLACLSAEEIDMVDESNFDITVMNSVVVCFSGLNYLRKVLKKVISIMKNNGIIFIGDIMDQDSKGELYQSLVDFKQKYPEYKTKTDLSNKLFCSKLYFEDLSIDIPEIDSIHISPKIYTIENELTKYRYDVLIKIDKNPNKKSRNLNKNKQQHGSNILQRYSLSFNTNI
ncbi:AMP-binding protein [Ruminiclostridium cellobioparum]|uniref:Acyl-CoA synthetases (AMP-forming)/AMP-acid ligases II n=1 Tax=Ruminiclostridium cellobioparum subsp. termitidis CT1112 TaxID=1195236 RepID=S0FHZ1_RUMCE|nr:methyltransferase domain-containing protein [Ruminiclostridium cellobioparum]EMS71435.1 Acyl-CoA synthetases (AMP-forming)/AMP-acid ligases II [Ruminiclostridium cellobioparum subsp. termitidis CT1112]